MIDHLNEVDLKLQQRVIYRKIFGWMMFGLGIALILVTVVITLYLLAILFFFYLFGIFFPAIFDIVTPYIVGVVVVSFILLSLTIIYTVSGIGWVKGKYRDFVTGSVYIFTILPVIGLLLSIIIPVANGTNINLGLVVVSLFLIGIFGFFIFALHYTWDTFGINGVNRKDEQRNRIQNWNNDHYKIERKSQEETHYSREYTMDLKKERNIVQHKDAEVLPAEMYDFSSISH